MGSVPILTDTVIVRWPLKMAVMSSGLISSGRLKNLRDVDEWSSQRLCLSVMGISVSRVWAVLMESGWVKY